MSARSSLLRPNALRRSARIAAAFIALSLFEACASDRPDPTGLQPGLTVSLNKEVPTETRASTVWQETARSLVARDKYAPVAGSHAYPILGVAQYLAVQRAEAVAHGRDDDESENQNHGGGDKRVRRFYSDRGAVAGASATTLSYLFPAAADVQTFENMVAAQANAVPTTSRAAFTNGVAIGRAVGLEIVTRSKGDRWNDPYTAAPPVGEGYWISNTVPTTIAGGQVPGVLPWFLKHADQFRPGPPPKFGSPVFNAALAQVRQYSDLKSDDPERIRQVGIAASWALNVGTPLTAGFWLEVASKEIERRQLSERTATHIYALLSAAIADASISCWDAKLTYWLIRPWQADKAIIPVTAVGKPNHPSYPSGHSCLSGAAGEVLSAFFPDKRREFDAMVTEAGMSRVYGGIHYLFDCETGQQLGSKVARFAISRDASGRSELTPRDADGNERNGP